MASKMLAVIKSGFWSDGYCVVKVDKKYGVIDKSGKYVINPLFDSISYY